MGKCIGGGVFPFRVKGLVFVGQKRKRRNCCGSFRDKDKKVMTTMLEEVK